MTVQANTVESIASGGAITTLTGSIGQVYAGTVNGQVVAPTIAPSRIRISPITRST